MGFRSRNMKVLSPQLTSNCNFEMNMLLNNSNKSSVGSRTPNFSDSKCQLIITSPQQRPYKMHPQQIFSNPNLEYQGDYLRWKWAIVIYFIFSLRQFQSHKHSDVTDYSKSIFRALGSFF